MRHRIHLRKLNRTSEHRRALLRNMAQSLIEHGQITTTIPKAKNLRPYIERIVTLAVKSRKFAAASDTAGALRARRGIHQLLGDRGIIPKEHRAAYEEMSDARRAKTLRMASGRRYRTGAAKGRLDFTAESVTHRLLETIAPRYENRPGGYTRVICLAKKRIGDAARLAVIQFVGDEEVPTSLTKPSKSGRRTRTNARYAMAIKLSKKRGRSEKKQTADKPDVEPDATEGDGTTEANSGE